MGKGMMIKPVEGVVRAPFDGEVMVAFPTGHALGLKSDNGAELLIHIGIDTVEMNGDGFELLVNQGDRIKAGQQLVRFDIEKIKAASHPTETMVIVTNTAAYENVGLNEAEGTVVTRV